MLNLAQRVVLALMLAAAPLGGAALADNPPINTDESGHAIRGFDPVAYFTDGAPQPGSESYAHDWNGATWLFTSAEHRDAFAADPERYAPQFGGYCAYAVAKGHAANADPRVWSIVDGKLYLNLGPGVQTMWQEDVPGNIARAQNNWPGALVDPGARSAQPAVSSDR